MEIALISIALSLLIVIAFFTAFAIYQLKLAGIDVKGFFGFVKASDKLVKLYKFSKKYQKLAYKDQLIFMEEAKKVFDAFEKVPAKLWEDDYNKYMDVLERYQKIKKEHWMSGNKKESLNEMIEKIKNKKDLKTLKIHQTKGRINIISLIKYTAVISSMIILFKTFEG